MIYCHAWLNKCASKSRLKGFSRRCGNKLLLCGMIMPRASPQPPASFVKTLIHLATLQHHCNFETMGILAYGTILPNSTLYAAVDIPALINSGIPAHTIAFPDVYCCRVTAIATTVYTWQWWLISFVLHILFSLFLLHPEEIELGRRTVWVVAAAQHASVWPSIC